MLILRHSRAAFRHPHKSNKRHECVCLSCDFASYHSIVDSHQMSRHQFQLTHFLTFDCRSAGPHNPNCLSHKHLNKIRLCAGAIEWLNHKWHSKYVQRVNWFGSEWCVNDWHRVERQIGENGLNEKLYYQNANDVGAATAA